MTTTWIIAADSSRARILQVTDRQGALAEVEDLLNPEGRVHDRELISDAHARFSGPAGDYLDKACTAHRYDRLHLIAPPKFLGQLRKELGKEVQKLVAVELPEDLSWLNTRQIEQSLAQTARGAAEAD